MRITISLSIDNRAFCREDSTVDVPAVVAECVDDALRSEHAQDSIRRACFARVPVMDPEANSIVMLVIIPDAWDVPTDGSV